MKYNLLTISLINASNRASGIESGPLPLGGKREMKCFSVWTRVPEYLVCLCLLVKDSGVNLSSQEVVSSCDGMDVSSKVQVELFHGNHL